MEQTSRKGRKTGYSRKKARKEYLAITKQKKPKRTKMRQAIERQLSYINKNIETLGNLLIETSAGAMPEKRLQRLMTICELYRQQQSMFHDKTHKCDNRIVSLKQPNIRPIVCGKAGKRYEFGQKLAFSVVDGFTFIEEQRFDNFNESTTFIKSVEAYKQRYSCYPEAVLADQIYRTRNNRDYCKKYGIRLSDPHLGRPKASEIEEDKKLAYQDSCERNIVESRSGIAKQRFELDLIMAYLPEIAMIEAALQVLAMNLSLRLRILLSFFKSWFLGFSLSPVSAF